MKNTLPHFPAGALKIAQRSVGIMSQGFNEESTKEIAKIVYEETGVGAVAITDREKILAFIGDRRRSPPAGNTDIFRLHPPCYRRLRTGLC